MIQKYITKSIKVMQYCAMCIAESKTNQSCFKANRKALLIVFCLQLYNKGSLCILALEFSELDLFARVLKVHHKR